MVVHIYLRNQGLLFESFGSIKTATDVKQANEATKEFQYNVFNGTNFNLITSRGTELGGKTLQFHLTSAEVFNIQQLIATKENLPTPVPTDLSPYFHELRFVFEPFSRDSEDGLYYGVCVAELKGMDNNGNEFIVQNLQSPGLPLLIHTDDWINFSSLLASSEASSILTDIMEKKYPYPEFPTSDLVKYLRDLREDTPSAFSDNVFEAITILRRHYYGRWDLTPEWERAVARLFNFEPFDYAIPSADASITQPLQLYVLPINNKVIDAYDHLFSKGNENTIRDNPSPYIIDPGGNRIDLGHMLYGLDGLIRDYYNTHDNYLDSASKYGQPMLIC